MAAYRGRHIAKLAESAQEHLLVVSIGVACTLDLDVLEQAEVLDLMLDTAGHERHGELLVVRLDAANVMRRACRQALDEIVGRLANLGAGSRGSLLVVGHVLREEYARDEGDGARLHELNQRRVHIVLVLEHKLLDAVGHLAGIVLDGELGGGGARLRAQKVLVARARRDELLHELGIGRRTIDGMDGLAGVIQHSHDSCSASVRIYERGAHRSRALQAKQHTGRLAAFNELAHDLVIKELDVLPLHALLVVLLLFTTDREVDKDLLQLLVDVVDAKLLKAIAIKDLESINVQDTNHRRGAMV